MTRFRVLDFAFFLRPLLLVPVWTTYILGYGRHGFWPADLGFWPGLLAITSACAAAFVLNQIFDLEADRENHKCPHLARGAITIRQAWILYVVLCLVTVGACVSWPRVALPVSAVLVLGVLYSAPPWRFKDRPYLGLAANFVAHGACVFLAGRAVLVGPWDWPWLECLPYAFGAAAAYLLTTLPDREVDLRYGKRTLAVTLGPERAARWALGWYLSALLLALYQVDVLFLLGALPSAWWFARAGRGDLAAATGAVRAAVLGLSVAAIFLQPWYAALLAAGFWATRVYFARRWTLRYP